MSKITGVLVDGHIFDMKKDMVEGCYFPNTLFPGATFKMVIDNDPANNGKVTWKCTSSLGSKPMEISGDGTVTFPGVNEQCCDPDALFYITATDKVSGEFSFYLFTVKRFFKYSKELYSNVTYISPWIKNMNGEFPETLDVNSQYINGPSGVTIIREVNGGLFQEWGNMQNSGWKIVVEHNYGNCGIYTFNNEQNFFNFLDDDGFTQRLSGAIPAQAVAFYGQSRV